MKEAGGKKIKNVTSVYMNSDGGEEAAKEVISLMESLFKAGKKDSCMVTFNLPARPSNQYRLQKLRIATPNFKTSVIYIKMPQYKICKSKCYTAINEWPDKVMSNSDWNSNRTDRSIATCTPDTMLCSQQLDVLKMYLKKITDLIEYSDSVTSKQYEGVNILDKAKQEAKQMILQSGENKDEGNIDELTFILQRLYENFDTFVPVFEENRGYAKDLLKFVSESKKRINKVEQDLLRFSPFDGVEISMLISEKNVKKVEESTANNEPDEKQLNTSEPIKSLVSNKNKSFLQAKTSSHTLNDSSPAWVLLPKGYYMVKSSLDMSDGFDVYLLHKVNEEDKRTDRNTMCIEPLLNIGGNEFNNVEEGTVIDVKPSIEADELQDEVQSTFDSLNIFPEKQNIQNYNAHIPSIGPERTSQILGNISTITKLIELKQKPDAQTKIIQDITDTINNEKNETTTSIKHNNKSANKDKFSKKSQCLIM